MLPAARIEHHISGRLRLRIPEMRGDDAYFERLGDALSRIQGAGVVSARARTGSVLLEDFSAGLPALARAAREAHWFELIAEQTPPERQSRGQGMGTLTAVTQDLDMATLRTSLVLILLALAGLQVARGQVMVPALTLLWFAFELSRRAPAAPTPIDWSAANHAVH
jgi:hypothetical protein